jgi:hypothetical protein
MAQQMVNTKKRRTNPRLGNLRFDKLELQLSHALPSDDISVCDIILTAEADGHERGLPAVRQCLEANGTVFANGLAVWHCSVANGLAV